MAIPQQIIDQIRQRASIADLVSEHVTLKAAGRRMLGLCPFHQEKTPSFYVREEEGDYICFGCGKKGSIFDFVMEVRAFSFPEAVRYLAARVGIEVPEDNPREKENRDKRQRLHRYLREIILATTEVYQDALFSEKLGKRARDYLERRGISQESIKTFMIGYAPPSWEFLVEALSAKLREKNQAKIVEHERFLVVLEKLGLIKKSDEGRTYDAFRDRIIFPISRSDGAPIALGGRILETRDGAPKYINSPETDIYQKRQTLYGINTALSSLRSSRHAYLVEGYMDVISMYQCGIENTLATCGTAVTQDHALVLKRFCDKLTLVFDGDSAGKKAAARSFEIFLNTGMEVSVALLPEGEDPDSLARNYGKEELSSLYREASKPIVEVYIDSLLAELRSEDDSPSAVICGKAAKRFVRTANAIENPVEKEQVLKFGAEKLGVSVNSLLDLLKQVPNKQNRSLEREYESAPIHKREWMEEDFTEAEQGRKLSKKDLLNEYYRDLVVSVVLEPNLAAKTLTTLSQNPNSILPETMLSFLEEVSKTAFEISNTNGKESKEDFSRLVKLISLSGFEAEEISAEVKKRRVVGGARPEHVMRDLLKVISLQRKKHALQEIKDKEHNAEDEDSLLRSVQEKLMARRGEGS